MQTELVRIQNGATPQDSYTYNLCPNKIFDAASVFLEPVLNNANFVCGNDGRRTNSCVIVGGTMQVRIVDSAVTGYPLQEISFTGITFSGFETSNSMSGTSIAAFASSAATATFTDCEWKVREAQEHIRRMSLRHFPGPNFDAGLFSLLLDNFILGFHK
jgi:hypothetical protein